MDCKCPCTCVKEQYCCDTFKCMDKDYCSYKRIFYLDCLPINFCPGCGKELPQSLDNEWKEVLMKEYGIEEDHCSIWNPMVPEEFKSDAWWKTRGL